MKMLGIEQASLEVCVREAQDDRVLVTRDGRPIAIVVGLSGLDEEQLQLGTSDEFWRMLLARRKQRTMTRSELEHAAGENELP